jgi:hypothetical protein
MLKIVFERVVPEPGRSDFHLFNLAHNTLLPIFSDGCDGRTSSRILLAKNVSILSPHLLNSFKDMYVSTIRETHHSELRLIIAPVISFHLRGFIETIQYIFQYPHCYLSLRDVCPIKTIKAICPNSPLLLTQYFACVPILSKEGKLFDQYVIYLAHQVIQPMKIITFGLCMEVIVGILNLLRRTLGEKALQCF